MQPHGLGFRVSGLGLEHATSRKWSLPHAGSS